MTEATPAKPRSGGFLRPLTIALLLMASLQLLTGFWVMRQLRKRLDLKISGTFWPIPLLPSFFSTDARFEWKNKVTLLSGNVKIDYNVIPSVTNHSIRVKIHGKDIHAVLGGDWAKMQGVENIKIDTFDADVDVARKGLGEIYSVRAESPSFHFVIQRNEN